MKILLPLISRSGQPIDSPVITGGIEKFSKNIYELFPGEIIPVIITSADRAQRKTKQVFLDAVEHHKPDLILTNDIDACFFSPQIDQKVPTVSIIHEPLCGDVRYLNLYKNLHKFLDAGGHIYFVSENQRGFFQKNIERVTGKPLDKIHGLINSSFCTGKEAASSEMLYDAVTIGRTDVLKNPFFVHRKLQNTGLKSCVMTTAGNFQKNPEQVKYYETNLVWQEPQYTFRGLSHDETMSRLSRSGCYISTCTSESWGVTALEALAHGVPLILVTDSTGRHSSESIAASSDHYRIVPKRIKPQELAEVVKELSDLPHEKRLEISRLTKEKHRMETYKDKFRRIFEERLL